MSASLEDGWTDLARCFWKIFVIVRIKLLGKKKLDKLPGKLDNWEKTEGVYFHGVFEWSQDDNSFQFQFIEI